MIKVHWDTPVTESPDCVSNRPAGPAGVSSGWPGGLVDHEPAMLVGGEDGPVAAEQAASSAEARTNIGMYRIMGPQSC
jgi:hypothetical protein